MLGAYGETLFVLGATGAYGDALVATGPAGAYGDEVWDRGAYGVKPGVTGADDCPYAPSDCGIGWYADWCDIPSPASGYA